MKTSLIQKYNIPGPRYTSYPTVPYWNKEGIQKHDWIQSFQKSFTESNSSEGISIYIHLPFCESLCTFCACHKHITKRHEVEDKYIDTLLKEWELYLALLLEKPIIKEIHHRVKNNLQVVNSLLRRQAEDIEDDPSLSR